MSQSAVEVLLDVDCPIVEKMVLLVIARHGRGTDGSRGYPGVRRLARIAGISTSTVQAALDSMRSKKWLSWSSGNAQENKPNIYTIHLDGIPMLPDLWRSSLQPCGDSRYSPVADPVATTATALWRLEAKPVAVAATEATTKEASTKAKKQKHKRAPKNGALVLSFIPPDWIPLQPWNGWVEMRKEMWKKGTPLNDHTLELAVQKLAKLRDAGDAPGDVLNHSILNGYRGLFSPNDRSSRKPPARQQISGIDYKREVNFKPEQAVGKI